MQNVACPSCGAPVQFRSHASVMAVCEYCKTTVLKDADSVKDLGKMSDVLEDYSPIQIGTTGLFGGRVFNVIGRIQLRYAAGLWNEWAILFDDGAAAWLSDSSGLYTLTTERPADAQLPTFEQLQPGQSYPISGQSFIVAEIRNADCIGGQGELPFKIGQGWRIRVADFRCHSSFLTLDYSDSELPKVYAGQAVTLDGLQCQMLRDESQIKEGASKFKGKIDALDCPSCGSSIKYLPGMTSHLVCPSCHAQIEAAGPTAQVLAAGERMAQVSTTLELGATAKIDNRDYQLIGLMKRRDDENTGWIEYLLYNAQAGFLWLVETDDGWARAKVLDSWPSWVQHSDTAKLGDRAFNKLYEYQATVEFAAGAFNWRVSAGDTNRVVEFENGKSKLAAEMTANELTWSLSLPVAADQIRAWFGQTVAADKNSGADEEKSLASRFMMWLLGLNAIPLIFSFGNTWLFIAFALAAIYFPAKYIESLGETEK
ncbi:MAG: DUF4178 domain-containing protein [Pseudomonadota bacterium]